MASTLEKMKSEATQVAIGGAEQSSRELVRISEEREHLQTLLKKLLGVEEQAIKKVKSKLVGLQQQEVSLKLSSLYPRLSLKALEWRRKDGWPELVVFKLDSPIFRIFVEVERPWNPSLAWAWNTEPKLPGTISSLYKDVTKRLLRVLEGGTGVNKTCSISTRFTGVIPDEVKEKIAKAEETGLFEVFFLIAEAKNFEKEFGPVDSDPLVVGFAVNQLWLIADFDTAPVEEAMIFTDPGC